MKKGGIMPYASLAIPIGMGAAAASTEAMADRAGPAARLLRAEATPGIILPGGMIIVHVRASRRPATRAVLS